MYMWDPLSATMKATRPLPACLGAGVGVGVGDGSGPGAGAGVGDGVGLGAGAGAGFAVAGAGDTSDGLTEEWSALPHPLSRTGPPATRLVESRAVRPSKTRAVERLVDRRRSQ